MNDQIVSISGLKRIKARRKRTEILYIFFGIHTSNAVRLVRREADGIAQTARMFQSWNETFTGALAPVMNETKKTARKRADDIKNEFGITERDKIIMTGTLSRVIRSVDRSCTVTGSRPYTA